MYDTQVASCIGNWLLFIEPGVISGRFHLLNLHINNPLNTHFRMVPFKYPGSVYKLFLTLAYLFTLYDIFFVWVWKFASFMFRTYNAVYINQLIH